MLPLLQPQSVEQEWHSPHGRHRQRIELVTEALSSHCMYSYSRYNEHLCMLGRAYSYKEQQS